MTDDWRLMGAALAYAPPDVFGSALDRAFPRLDRVAPAGKELIVAGLVRAISEDGSVRVLDKGPGIPRADRALMVRRFWRARRDQDGAGLGLSIVSRIAELHGAKLDIADRDGGGAVFSLSFEVA